MGLHGYAMLPQWNSTPLQRKKRVEAIVQAGLLVPMLAWEWLILYVNNAQQFLWLVSVYILTHIYIYNIILYIFIFIIYIIYLYYTYILYRYQFEFDRIWICSSIFLGSEEFLTCPYITAKWLYIIICSYNDILIMFPYVINSIHK